MHAVTGVKCLCMSRALSVHRPSVKPQSCCYWCWTASGGACCLRPLPDGHSFSSSVYVEIYSMWCSVFACIAPGALKTTLAQRCRSFDRLFGLRSGCSVQFKNNNKNNNNNNNNNNKNNNKTTTLFTQQYVHRRTVWIESLNAVSVNVLTMDYPTQSSIRPHRPCGLLDRPPGRPPRKFSHSS